jgi:hypothetical protein
MVWLEEKMMMKGKFLNLLNLKQAELEKMKIKENGWLLDPMPNAQECVYLTVHMTKLQLQTTFPNVCLFVVWVFY